MRSMLRSMHMGQAKGSPSLDPVLENHLHIGPPIAFTRQASTQYKPHKYGSSHRQSRFLRPFSFFVKLRDRYVKAMNEMAMGSDFTAVTGYHGWTEVDYTLQHSQSVKDRHVELLQEESAAITRSKSQGPR